MKALKSKLLVSITTLVIALVSVAGSAYAWFTLSNTATTTMQFTVTSGDGLQLRLAGGEWRSSLNLADWLAANFTDGRLNAVTSPNGSTGFQKLQVNNADPEAPVYSLTSAGANTDYVSFVLQFRTPTNVGSLQLDTTNSKAVNVIPGATVEAANAVRVSFESGATTRIWEPNKDAGEGSYIANLAAPNIDGAWSYFTNTISEGADITALTTYHTANSSQTTNADLNALSAVSSWTVDGSYYVGSVTVRIWLEGFDEDAFDAIFRQVFNIDLVFVKG